MSATLTTDLRENGLLVVAFQGTLDAAGVEQVGEAFGEAVSHYTGPLVVDLSEVDYVSSAGLSLLVSRGKSQRGKGGDLVVVANSPRVLEVFEMMGFQNLFSVYGSVEAALGGVDAFWSGQSG